MQAKLGWRSELLRTASDRRRAVRSIHARRPSSPSIRRGMILVRTSKSIAGHFDVEQPSDFFRVVKLLEINAVVAAAFESVSYFQRQ